MGINTDYSLNVQTPHAAKNVEVTQSPEDIVIFGDNGEDPVETNPPSKAEVSIKNEIKSGNAEYNSALRYLFRQVDRHKLIGGSMIMLENIPEGCKTLGDIKRKLHLPDGCLRNNILKGDGGGNFDAHTAYAPISISVNVLSEKLGISKREIRAWFEEK